MAKLVKGVYELEHRRMVQTSADAEPPARRWWESVNFELVRLQEEEEQRKKNSHDEEKSINLAVYRWNSASPAPPPPQKVVIAVRGTLPRMDDGWHNMHIPLQRLHETPRYKEIMAAVKSAVATHGSQEVCIVGHSLGAALGLLVARSLAVDESVRIESHLFNPVYPYTWVPGPHELIGDEALWSTIRAMRYAATVGLTHLLVDAETRSSVEAEFLRLQDWTPHIYVNKGDPICRGYWEYFHSHERLARQGSLGARVSSMAAPYSTRGLAFRGSKPVHLVPSVVLHLCAGAPMDVWTDLGDYRYFHHNLKNWWTKDLQVQTRHVRIASW